MSKLDFTGFADRKPLSGILEIPKKVQSVYSLTQHVWAGENEEERRESKKQNRVRLETLDELLIDPVRSYLHRILEKVAAKEGQGYWVQAEFGVGKSHLLAAGSIVVVGGQRAWDHVKEREDAEGKAGPGARLDTLWRKKLEVKKIFPIVFSLEGVGGAQQSKLEDFILEEAQRTFALREGKPLAVYPEEHLAALFLKEHQKIFKDNLRTFLADKRLMRGLPRYDYDELIAALKKPESQKDAGRLLMAFYRHENLVPQVPVERGQRLSRMTQDVFEAGYEGILVVIDEMSEYLRRAVQFNAEDEDCLLTLSNTLAHVQGLPIWTIVAAQMAHTNPQKIIAPDRLRQETLEHKPERFRDIVVQRARRIKDGGSVKVYFNGYRNLVPWVKEASFEDFEASFPFPPDAVNVVRNISKQLTGTRSTISFLHRALQTAASNGSNELVPLWRVFDDLMSYNETPSTAGTGTVSIRSQFRGEVAALEAAQATLKRITDGQLARPQNRTRAERILNTLFLYHISGVAGLTKEQILDAVSDLKPGEDELEAQLNHYETILEEMRRKLRNQIRFQQGRYEFVAKETSQYDDLVNQWTDKLKSDPQLLSQMVDRLMAFSDPECPSPFSGFVLEGEQRLVQFRVERWHGQERTGRVTCADLSVSKASHFEVDTHSNEDDFLIIISLRPIGEKALDNWLKKDRPADPRIVVWAPAELKDDERATMASVLAHLKVSEEFKETNYGKEGRREFKREAHRAFAVLQSIYGRGIAKTIRTSPTISLVGGVEGALVAMAAEAMDTCYESREIDFGARKFDTPNAIKLVNGLVRLGRAVSEGDVLWSAVENFAGPLGLVRPEAPKRLDPSDSRFFQAIRQRVESHGAGLEVKTAYNWFTGYNPTDGQESPGLTRRMVDIYLLCLAQQGVIRISQKGGAWIDRATIGAIDFKPDVLRGMQRIELPRALDDWEVFAPYLEILTGRSDLGPKYDHAKADDALQTWWRDKWPERSDLERIEHAVRDLFGTLGRAEKSPFDELLLYWLEFADEERSGEYRQEEAFDALRRAVLRASGTQEPQALTPGHLATFRADYRRLKELRDSFDKTSVLLLRAAKMASAPVPDGEAFAELRIAQQEVLDELKNAESLILSLDTLNTRLVPRFSSLETLYKEAFLADLIRLESIQGQLEELCGEVERSPELKALEDLVEIPEAKRIAESCRQVLGEVPCRLRKSPEDRDKAEKELAVDGRVKDLRGEDITMRRLSRECDSRIAAQASITDSPRDALKEFATFLKSPGVVEHLKAIEAPTKEILEIRDSPTVDEVAEAILTMPSPARQELGKLLKAILGNKRPRTVSLAKFVPQTSTVWEEGDINKVTQEFGAYLTSQWEPGVYLKIEK
jgi:hypothetical protein